MENVISNQTLTGERALFQAKDLEVRNCIFADGESPLKESKNIDLFHCSFRWKYPLWYAENVFVKDSDWHEMGRAGVWYTNHTVIEDCLVEAPKNFRRCNHLKLHHVSLPNASETLWHCSNVELSSCDAKGDYFAMNCSDITVDGLKLDGNYPFDGCKNVVVRNSTLISKDAFWNCENVTVYDTYISGEYLAWNSKNVTLINCTIESLQGLCYIENLKLVNCNCKDTNYAFEYSTVEAQITGSIESVLNPSAGSIVADKINTLILDPEKINPQDTVIKAAIGQTLDKAPAVFD